MTDLPASRPGVLLVVSQAVAAEAAQLDRAGRVVVTSTLILEQSGTLA